MWDFFTTYDQIFFVCMIAALYEALDGTPKQVCINLLASELNCTWQQVEDHLRTVFAHTVDFIGMRARAQWLVQLPNQPLLEYLIEVQRVCSFIWPRDKRAMTYYAFRGMDFELTDAASLLGFNNYKQVLANTRVIEAEAELIRQQRSFLTPLRTSQVQFSDSVVTNPRTSFTPRQDPIVADCSGYVSPQEPLSQNRDEFTSRPSRNDQVQLASKDVPSVQFLSSLLKCGEQGLSLTQVQELLSKFIPQLSMSANSILYNNTILYNTQENSNNQSMEINSVEIPELINLSEDDSEVVPVDMNAVFDTDSELETMEASSTINSPVRPIIIEIAD
jgi:hypothetical protein